MSLLNCAALAAAFAAATFLHAQKPEPEVSLSGHILDAQGRGIEGVEILVAGFRGSTRTQSDGRFRMNGIRPGATTVTARRIGFAPTTRAALLLAGESSMDLVLAPLPYRLAAVHVRPPAALARHDQRMEAFHRRRAHGGGGTFVTRADIERIQARQLSDILQLAPGFRTQRQAGGSGIRVMAARGAPSSCRIKFYLDGLGVELINNDLDLMVRVQDVEAVELYRGASTTPPQFSALDRRGDVGCGAIVVWTRQR